MKKNEYFIIFFIKEIMGMNMSNIILDGYGRTRNDALLSLRTKLKWFDPKIDIYKTKNKYHYVNNIYGTKCYISYQKCNGIIRAYVII